MPSWFDKFRGSPDGSEVATYQAIRAASKSWFPKVMAHPASKPFDVKKAAKKLGLPVENGTVVFDAESEMAVLMDYYLFDYRPNERSVLESCMSAPGDFTPLEVEIHQAHLASRTSLFEVTAVHEREPKILLRDRLNKDAPETWLIDLGLSDTFRRLGGKALFFTRVISLRGLHMTGGYSFAFEPKHEFVLVDEYRRAMWSVPAARQASRRTGYFLDLNRKLGLEQAYTDVPPHAKSDAG